MEICEERTQAVGSSLSLRFNHSYFFVVVNATFPWAKKHDWEGLFAGVTSVKFISCTIYSSA